MPYRDAPRSDAHRFDALRDAKTKKDSTPGQTVISVATVLRLDAAVLEFDGLLQTEALALQAQVQGTENTDLLYDSSKMWFSHIIQHLNQAIERKEFDPSVRAFYKIDASDDTVPVINNDDDLKTWGKNLVDGEAARVAAGGALMTFPTVLDFDNNHFKLWKTSLTAHSTLKDAYDNAQEAIAGKRTGYDSLIARVWDEIETFFGELESTGKRRHAREWGVVYAPNPGEKVTIVIPPNSTVAAQNFIVHDDTDYHGKNVSGAAITLCRGALSGTPCATGFTLNGASESDFNNGDLGASGDFLNATNHDPAIEVTVVVTVL